MPFYIAVIQFLSLYNDGIHLVCKLNLVNNSPHYIFVKQYIISKHLKLIAVYNDSFYCCPFTLRSTSLECKLLVLTSNHRFMYSHITTSLPVIQHKDNEEILRSER